MDIWLSKPIFSQRGCCVIYYSMRMNCFAWEIFGARKTRDGQALVMVVTNEFVLTVRKPSPRPSHVLPIFTNLSDRHVFYQMFTHTQKNYFDNWLGDLWKAWKLDLLAEMATGSQGFDDGGVKRCQASWYAPLVSCSVIGWCMRHGCMGCKHMIGLFHLRNTSLAFVLEFILVA